MITTTPLVLLTPNFTIERDGSNNYTIVSKLTGSRTRLSGLEACRFYDDVCRRSMDGLEACAASYTGGLQ